MRSLSRTRYVYDDYKKDSRSYRKNPSNKPQLDLILPEELYSLIQTKLLSHGTTTYAKVHMSLASILDPDFFNPYIKQGMCSSPFPPPIPPS